MKFLPLVYLMDNIHGCDLQLAAKTFLLKIYSFYQDECSHNCWEWTFGDVLSTTSSVVAMPSVVSTPS